MPKCKCTSTKEGWVIKECKYHKEHCHYGDCKKKLKKDEYDYCKIHQDCMNSQADPEGYGGSDF
jgi:hypothetical protein